MVGWCSMGTFNDPCSSINYPRSSNPLESPHQCEGLQKVPGGSCALAARQHCWSLEGQVGQAAGSEDLKWWVGQPCLDQPEKCAKSDGLNEEMGTSPTERGNCPGKTRGLYDITWYYTKANNASFEQPWWLDDSEFNQPRWRHKNGWSQRVIFHACWVDVQKSGDAADILISKNLEHDSDVILKYVINYNKVI